MMLTLLCIVLSFFVSAPQGQKVHSKSNSEASTSVSRNHGNHRLTKSEMQAMVLAIQDEIYDYGYEGKYYEIGDNLGTSAHWISRVPVYVDPEMKDGVGHAIYKLMPYGEVFRDFDIGEDGLVGLTGNPQLGFPPTQPSHKTIYMDDDELCKMKHAWLRLTFEVNDSPTPEMRQESAKRQKSRIGFSDWEYRLSNQHDNPNK